MTQIIAILIIAAAAGFVQTVIGFGFSIVALPFIVMFLPLQQSVAIMSIIGVLCYIRVVWLLRAHIDFKIVYIPLTASIVGRLIGIQFLFGAKTEYIKILLGFCLIALAIYFTFYKEKVKVKYNVKNGLTFGFISGIFAGMFNIGGPPIVLYYMAGNLSKEKYMATLQLFFTMTTLFSAFLHAIYGNIKVTTLAFSGIGFAGVFIGGILGSLVYNKMNLKTFNYAVYVFLVVSGIYTVVNSIMIII